MSAPEGKEGLGARWAGPAADAFLGGPTLEASCTGDSFERKNDVRGGCRAVVDEVDAVPLEKVSAYDDLQFGNHDDIYAGAVDHRLLNPRGDCPFS
eukprot:2570777-Heterocapsa_arctica.AAC.1